MIIKPHAGYFYASESQTAIKIAGMTNWQSQYDRWRFSKSWNHRDNNPVQLIGINNNLENRIEAALTNKIALEGGRGNSLVTWKDAVDSALIDLKNTETAVLWITIDYDASRLGQEYQLFFNGNDIGYQPIDIPTHQNEWETFTHFGSTADSYDDGRTLIEVDENGDGEFIPIHDFNSNKVLNAAGTGYIERYEAIANPSLADADYAHTIYDTVGGLKAVCVVEADDTPLPNFTTILSLAAINGTDPAITTPVDLGGNLVIEAYGLVPGAIEVILRSGVKETVFTEAGSTVSLVGGLYTATIPTIIEGAEVANFPDVGQELQCEITDGTDSLFFNIIINKPVDRELVIFSDGVTTDELSAIYFGNFVDVVSGGMSFLYDPTKHVVLPSNTHTNQATGIWEYYGTLFTTWGMQSFLVSSRAGAYSNTAPVANAGVGGSAISGDEVTLNGTATDVDGDETVTSYQWRQVQGPITPLSDETLPNPTFTAPVVSGETTLIYGLIVTDDQGLDSEEVLVTYTITPNLAPVVNAGNDQQVLTGSTVTLTAAAVDPENRLLSYQWTQLEGANITLNNSTKAVATFNVTLIDTYVFEVEVTDDAGNITTDSVTITAVSPNQPPVASAGPDQLGVAAATEVTLNATGTSDPNDNLQSILWTQVQGVTVEVKEKTTLTPYFVTPSLNTESTLVFMVTVSDGEYISSDTVTVTVLPFNPGIKFERDELERQFLPDGTALAEAGSISPVSNVSAGGAATFINSPYSVDVAQEERKRQILGYDPVDDNGNGYDYSGQGE